jgi:hypothetical protein
MPAAEEEVGVEGIHADQGGGEAAAVMEADAGVGRGAWAGGEHGFFEGLVIAVGCQAVEYDLVLQEWDVFAAHDSPFDVNDGYAVRRSVGRPEVKLFCRFVDRPGRRLLIFFLTTPGLSGQPSTMF